LLHSKSAATPLDSKLKLESDGEALDSPSHYQKLVRKLIYLTITRPDIAFAVSLVSQHMHAPTIQHLGIVKRILRYLKGSIGRGIVMNNNGHTNIMGYSDSDWAGNALDRRSTTDYCMFVGGNLVSWKSKKQNVVARSSTEAEYHAMTSTACELVWLKRLLTDLCCPCSILMTLYCEIIVIIKQPCTLRLILFFMNARSTLKLIVTTFSNKFSQNLLLLIMCVQPINWQICLPRFCQLLNFTSY